jgi:putative ABC transport system permease protein
MRVLDRKLLRDLWRLKTQALAIALVMAAGAATLILGAGVYRSLDETRAALYERQRFADIFATVRRAPDRLREEIAEIPGVAAVETRIVDQAVLAIEGMIEPASAMLVSVPDSGEEVLNALYMRIGRLPDPSHPDEVVVNEAFADAHGFAPGSRFAAILNGRMRDLEVVGVALSPEYIYTLPPGAIMPDDRRYAILWMSRRALAAAFDLEGAFSAVAVKLLAGASESEAIERVDALLDRYGGRGAYGHGDQQSHAFLSAELDQLQAMSRVLPPIFLFVAAFLVNMTLTRLVALEREQIGLMKALGYGSRAVAWHYLMFVVAIAAIGLVIGAAAGTMLGRGMAALYSQFFQFPFLIFHTDPAVYLIAASVTVLTATLGAARAVWGVAGLSPAVAMQPPAPTRYRRLLRGLPIRLVSQTTVMVGRSIVRWPLRAAFTVVGIALSVAVLVASLFSQDAIDHMIDVTFFRADRQDASITFALERPLAALADVERLPGVLAAEPVRTVAARLSRGHVSRRVAIQGHAPDADLSRLLDLDHRPVRLPETGLVLTDMLAGILDARVGDLVQVEVLEGRRPVAELPVTAVVQSYIGLAAYMELAEVNRLMREGAMMSGANLMLDPLRHEALFASVKEMPAVAGVGLQRQALETLRATMAENILIMTGMFTALALIIAFGVVYNSARIQLSERARELASLRVLGFTRAEVSWILLAELALLTLAALPLGWLIGYILALGIVVASETELFRIPLVIERATYAWAGLNEMAVWIRRILLVLLLGAGVAAGAWALRPQPVPVDMALIERGGLEITVDEEGRTRVRDTYIVSAPVAGTVLRAPLHVGDEVQAAETIVAVIEPTIPAFLDMRARREAEAAIAAAEAASVQAAAELREAQSQLDFASSQLSRSTELARRGTISTRQLDEARLQTETAQSRVASAEAMLSVRRRELESAHARLIGPETLAGGRDGQESCCISLRAPIDGTVLNIVHESEQVVNAGTTLVEIGDMADMEIVAELLSSDAVRVRPGAAASVTAWGGPGALSAGVRRVEPTGFTKVSALGIEEQRVRVLLDFDAPFEQWSALGHGFRVLVHITVEVIEDAVLVPIGALFRRGGDWAVYVVEEDNAAERFVELGPRTGRYTAVERIVELGPRTSRYAAVASGLSAGEQVILHPGDRVASGVAVTQRQ